MVKIKNNFGSLRAKILEANGLKGIIINFEGSGDSGGIDDIKFYSNLEKEKEFQGKISDGLKEKIEELAYDYIEKSGDIDFNNDGCRGRFIIDLEKMTIKKENNSFYTESNYSEEQWNLE